MNLDKIEIHILNSLCDDHESIHTIQEDLYKAVNNKISESLIIEYLRKLISNSLIDGFKYDIDNRVFLKQNILNDIDFLKDWFLINDRGRGELDANWKGKD